MVIVKLTGGLGNQMFQYAYGRAETLQKKQTFLYYFLHNFGDTNRQYELDVFNIKGKKIKGFFPEFFRKAISIVNFGFFKIESGYWQSEKYFSKYKDTIKQDFVFKNRLDERNIKILESIKSTNSVSIHVRRGDYVNDKKINEFHGVLGEEYYEGAINFISKKIKDPKYFIFSDDLGWAKKHLMVKNAIYIDWNKGKESYKDMYLMNNCKHNIIANSSFSWWGAWLNDNPDKIVVAPKKWFNNSDAQEKIGRDIIPRRWIKI